MTAIMLYNTKTRRKEPLDPLDPDNVRMYVCGPTVYDRAHLGNARPVVVFDALYRLLRRVHGPECVTYVRNFTDVDDKINARARQTGREISEITEETKRWFIEDMALLGALEPDHAPCATDHIPQMVEMIAALIARGHAYEAEGHVLFRVRSYPEYGSLSGRSVDDMIAGARVEVAPFKEDPMDFVLWKPSGADLPGWDSPWGRGRPGWHIECSAMSRELLGDSFDIHGGGNDLTFPHHENEIAQSRCAHPSGSFATIWMHNEMLRVEGRKMSKSLGNFFTVRDLLDQGHPGAAIRFVFLSAHYRKPMDWTQDRAMEARRELRAWHDLTEGAEAAAEPPGAVVEALCDDLNTPAAITELRRLAAAGDASALRAGMDLIGVEPLAPQQGELNVIEAFAPRRQGLQSEDSNRIGYEPLGQYDNVLTAFAYRLAVLQDDAASTKNFAEVDRLKTALVGIGVEVRIDLDGVRLLAPDTVDQERLNELQRLGKQLRLEGLQ